MGHPAVSLPSGSSRERLLRSMQSLVKLSAEAMILRWMHHYNQATTQSIDRRAQFKNALRRGGRLGSRNSADRAGWGLFGGLECSCCESTIMQRRGPLPTIGSGVDWKACQRGAAPTADEANPLSFRTLLRELCLRVPFMGVSRRFFISVSYACVSRSWAGHPSDGRRVQHSPGGRFHSRELCFSRLTRCGTHYGFGRRGWRSSRRPFLLPPPS
jgi:hypothetical protein